MGVVVRGKYRGPESLPHNRLDDGAVLFIYGRLESRWCG